MVCKDVGAIPHLFFSLIPTNLYILKAWKHMKNTEKTEKIEGKMVNLVSTKTSNGNLIVSMEDTKYYYLPFDKSPVDLADPKIRDKFIKSIEKLVRNSRHYKQYINYLKSDLGLNSCAIFGNIQSTKKSKTKIEMHHGPIFTLYDIVSIVLEKHLCDLDHSMTTFAIAAEVLELHRRKLIQTVMLSQSVHKSMDNKEKAPFIPLEMTFGNLYQFIVEYGKYFSPTHRNNLKKYFVNYGANLNTKKLNMFEPIMTKYNIKIVKSKMEIE